MEKYSVFKEIRVLSTREKAYKRKKQPGVT